MNAANAAHGHRKECCDTDEDQRSDDGVGHPAAGFSNRLRHLGEEIEVQRAGAFLDHIEEDHRQRNEGDDYRKAAKAFEDAGEDLAPAEVCGHANASPADTTGAAIGAATRRFIDQISSREIMFTPTVMMKRSRPISIRACRYSSSAASVNSLAMTAAIVYCGLNIEAATCGEMPSTIVTAIVSPSARPKPSMTARSA